MPDTLLTYFEERIHPEPNSGCWLWTGSFFDTGYGRVYFNKERLRAHRVSYELFNGAQVPEDTLVCHKCDTRACVNPDHLWLGTHKANLRDCRDKGRMYWQSDAHRLEVRGENSITAKLTEDDVRLIFADPRDGPTIAAEYGLNSRQSVYNIKSGHSWRHVTSPLLAAVPVG